LNSMGGTRGSSARALTPATSRSATQMLKRLSSRFAFWRTRAQPLSTIVRDHARRRQPEASYRCGPIILHCSDRCRCFRAWVANLAGAPIEGLETHGVAEYRKEAAYPWQTEKRREADRWGDTTVNCARSLRLLLLLLGITGYHAGGTPQPGNRWRSPLRHPASGPWSLAICGETSVT
jgi:hypothetical protein